jgi:hypothetical protein
MSNLVIGLIIAAIGIVITICTILILMLVIRLLSSLFPDKDGNSNK